MAEGPFYGGLNNVTNFANPRIKKSVTANIPSAMNLRKKVRLSQPRRNIHNRVVLEKVLGITTSSSSGLACDPNTGLVAYPAGCVVVILHPKKNKQSHILNTSRKTFTALAFSQDGKYLVTGESGHMPCVRVWDVAERTQVAEVQCHKYGVACVAFSTNSSYIVSVGYQHDMTVSVWEWRKGTVIASNKVSSRVLSVSFSEDNSYFVTAGNRHIKFWYLDASKERRVNSTVPLIGRSGLLGEQRNSMFCDLACGLGNMAGNTYCITSSGLLCQFNSRRLLEAWVDLKTSSARCLTVSKDYVFCGCAAGTVRVFSPQNLHYITTLHRPHCLGVDITQGIQPGHLFSTMPEAEYPDTVALTYDPVARCLTCVYNDHSVYVWDIRDIRNVGKVYSALYHGGCVWSVETYPDVEELSRHCLPPGSFLTCSSDNTIRLWHTDPQQTQSPRTMYHRNLYSHDLMKIVYVGKDTQHLQCEGELGEGSSSDAKSGIRVLGISPDGQHLAAGDRNGNLRIFSLQFLDEILKIEAHDSEVLCLEFSPTETGLHLLASASRDRLIHIFNIEKEYELVQTVYDHSASITAIKFTGVGPDVRMVSCGADKSIYFRTAEKSSEGLTFSRSHHVVEKATLYDMDLDAARNHAAIACQDRNIRVYNVKSGKMKKCFKGSVSDDGTLLKVQMDPSGMFLATSCSDKNICIFDYESGECVATLFGHSEIVTGMRFSQDCRHLITVSGDSCVIVWRLDSQMTNSMRKRLAEIRQRAGLQGFPRTTARNLPIRRQTYISVPRPMLAQTGGVQEEEEEDAVMSGEEQEEHPKTPARDDSAQETLDPMFLQTNGKLPMWARRLGAAGSSANPMEQKEVGPYQPRGRWAEQSDPEAIRSVLETRSLQLPLSPSPKRNEEGEDEEGEEEEDESCFHPQSLDSLLAEDEEDEEEEDEEKMGLRGAFVPGFPRPGFLPLPDGEEPFPAGLSSPETSDYVLYPTNSTTLSTGAEGDFDVKELCEASAVPQREGWVEEELSPDSACCMGSTESQASNQDQPQEDTDSLSQVSSTGSTGLEEEEEEPETLLRQHFDTLADCLASTEKFDTDLQDLQPPTESIFLNPRLSISTRFLSRFQGRIASKLGVGLGLRPVASLPASISEEAISRVPSLAKTEAPPSGPHPVVQPSASLPLRVSEDPSSRALSLAKTEVSSKPSDGSATQEGGKYSEVTDKAQSSLSSSQSGGLMSSQRCSTPSAQKPPLPGTDKDSAPPQPHARPPRQSYMCATASSRAKMSRSSSVGENLNVSQADEQSGKPVSLRASSTQDLHVDHEHKENLPPPANPTPIAFANTATSSSAFQAPVSQTPPPTPPPGNHRARAALHLDLPGPDRAKVASPSPLAHKSRRRTVGVFQPSAVVTPTEMRSLGKETRSYISTIEESIAPRDPVRTKSLALSSASITQQSETAASSQSPTVVQEESGIQEPLSSVEQESLPSGCLSPLPGGAAPEQPLVECSASLHADAVNVPVNLQACKQVVNELQHSMKRAVSLYSKLSSMKDNPEQQLQMRSILTDAFSAVQSELDSVCPQSSRPPGKTSCPSAEESPGRQLKDERTVALLEKYSEMLLRIAEKKLDCS
ncbi:WD repeat-containing protein 62 [Megalops cyprinoides]|uniref:WD repeat-containing protein 62 n=1 Tax=Megalops cyprinoides TaxID=118141 RepID=UPI0018647479|nr:WD repeat-containing protein 62 [Megalops cyprinoides]